MKNSKVIILGCLFLSGIGCSSEYNLATNQQETLLFGTEKEMKIGEAVARQFDSNFAISDDAALNERVRKILDRIVAVCDRQELVYTIKVIDEDKMNAVSLPGGYVYIYKGLIDKLDNDDQLASVIGHEVGHIAARHAIKRLQGSYGYMVLQVLAVGSGNANVAQGVQTAYLSMFLAHSREDEYEADRIGIKYMKEAGYDVKEVTNVLKKLKAQEDKEPSRELSYWRTHPHLSERISYSNKEISGELHFKDYLNIMGNDEPVR
ncbi:MAG: hypothetical protein A2787_06200 [Omnitrophica WOR_2 bacterium RIFCSPHIGHO2_01_FULL_48_9]|nr:MAG: hypothetical protein A2787_06200 [Omnitrophica WOR_2 bacterium RIFCSPHIGHO2_01_FULL_48_9]